MKNRKYISLVIPQDYPETTDLHILPGVGRKNIFGGNIHEISFRKNIFDNHFVEDNSQNILDKIITFEAIVVKDISGTIFIESITEHLFCRNIFENFFSKDNFEDTFSGSLFKNNYREIIFEINLSRSIVKNTSEVSFFEDSFSTTLWME